MKSMFNILIVLSVLLSANTGYAQIKNPKKETIKILGNCDRCKSDIEKAGNLKNEVIVIWNKDSKIAEITFDSKKTSLTEILKRIALAGYDSDQYLAPDMAYAQLAECCKYERKKQMYASTEVQPKMEMDADMHHPEKHTEMAMPDMMPTNGLDALFDNYFAIKDALVKTNATAASAKASELLTAIKDLKIESLKAEEQTVVTKIMPLLMDAAKSISETKDIGKQRETFKMLSKNIHGIVTFYNSNETIYYQYCPMQDANWLSKDSTIKNPYYGSQMLSCGSTVETIDKKN